MGIEGRSRSDISLVHRALGSLVLLVLVGAAAVSLLTRAAQPDFSFEAWGPGTPNRACLNSASDCQIRVPRNAQGELAFSADALLTDAPSAWYLLCSTAQDRGTLNTRRIWADPTGAGVESSLPQIPFAISLASMSLTAEALELPPDRGNCGFVGQSLVLATSERPLINSANEESGYSLQTILGLEADGRQVVVETPVIPVSGDTTYEWLDSADAIRFAAAVQTSSGRSVGLRPIWLSTLAVLAIIALSSAPLLGVARRATGFAAEATRSRMRILRILNSSHHEFERELLLTRFAADDLESDGVDTTELESALGRLESTKETLTALAHITSQPPVVHKREVDASMLLPTSDGSIDIRASGDNSTAVVADLLLFRVFVRTAFETSLQFTAITTYTVGIESDGVVIDDDGEPRLAQARKWWRASLMRSAEFGDAAFMREVASLHDATVGFDESPLGGVQIRVRFPVQSMIRRNNVNVEVERPVQTVL